MDNSKTEKEITFYCDGGVYNIEEIQSSLDRLKSILDEFGIYVKFVPAAPLLFSAIKRLFHGQAELSPSEEVFHRLGAELRRLNSNTIVFCSNESIIARSAKIANPMAEWGISYFGVGPSIVWEHSQEFIAWHEILHMLGADDCYDRSGMRTCELETCLMQWEPTAKNIGSGPYLCGSRVAEIKKHAKT